MKTNVATRFIAISLPAIALAHWLANQPPSTAALGGGSAQPPLGKECTVQFRRGDALGAAANLPVPPTAGNINGASTSVSGILRTITSEWLSLESR